MAGLYLEEFQVGQVFRHGLTKTVTESDNMLFSVMTLNPQPLHIDFDFAAKTEWGKPLVNSLFTLGLMIGISVHDTTLGTTIANLGMTETVFPAPGLPRRHDPGRDGGAVRARTPSRNPIAASSSSSTAPSTRTACWWRNASGRR